MKAKWLRRIGITMHHPDLSANSQTASDSLQLIVMRIFYANEISLCSIYLEIL